MAPVMLLKSQGVDESHWDAKEVRSFINYNKDEGLRPDDIRDDNDPARRQLIAFYRDYQTACERAGLLDFAELLLRAYELFAKNPDVLYVGTDIGVYVSLDGGASWHTMVADLPSTYVHDLVVHPRDDIMVAATHGRGMFAIDVRPIQQLTQEVTGEAVSVLVPPEHGKLPQATGGRGGGFGGAGVIRPVLYYGLASAGPVTLTIKDGAGDTVATLPATGDAGLNSVVWGMTRSGGPPQAGRGGGMRANYVDPGVYTVEVRQGGNVGTGYVHVSR